MASVRPELMTQADVTLLRLNGNGLRGTFAQAYALLCDLVAKIGWDELLKIRSTVFVMEEEYRLHKTNGHDDNASTAALRSPSPSEVPTIRISSDSTRPIQNGADEKPPTSREDATFSNKRLCERWLGELPARKQSLTTDNLFL